MIISEVALDGFDCLMALNVRGSFITFRAVIHHMLRRKYGSVLHIASISGKEGHAGMLACSVSKAAVIRTAMAAFIASTENSFKTGFTFDLTGGHATY